MGGLCPHLICIMSEIKSYKDLKVWQKSMLLVKETYSLINALPESERFALANQMQRSVVSVPSNIAEGQQRGTRKEYVRFLNFARGSNAELQTQFDICVMLGYLDEKQTECAYALTDEISKMLNALVDKLKD